MDTAAQWPQQDTAKPIEEMMLPLPNPSPSTTISMERSNQVLTKPHKDSSSFFSCPRCNSNNTKFCYYNNYSLSQPRFFCKTCRRYWTQGGSLRNIPVGGASRKIHKINIRPTTSSSNINNNFKKLQEQQSPSGRDRDLNLGFSIPADMIQMPTFQTPDSSELSASSLNFSLDGLGCNYGDFLGAQGNNQNNNSENKILFPFEDLKVQDNQNGDPSNVFWNGVVGGGSW